MPTVSFKRTGSRDSRPPASLRRALVVALALALLGVWGGCGVVWGRAEHATREKRRQAKELEDCRYFARRDCHYLAKEDESLDKDACISESAWQCSLGKEEEEEEEADSEDSAE